VSEACEVDSSVSQRVKVVLSQATGQVPWAEDRVATDQHGSLLLLRPPDLQIVKPDEYFSNKPDPLVTNCMTHAMCLY
jgi:hypothetical protein